MMQVAMWIKTVKGATGLTLLLAAILANANAAADFASRADAYLTKPRQEDEFSGAVLVATKGRVVFANCYGMANRELGVANTTNMIFRLGSVTKQFTAMCILILQEEHKLSVTNLISQYVEDCPKAWRGITIHHLLTHTAGIPSFTGFQDNLRFERLPTTVAATVKRFKDEPLDFEPGTRMQYSNSGYVLLGYIIERVTGKSYEGFVTEKIFHPLGMHHSGYDHPAKILPNRAAGYSKRGTNIVNCVPFAMDTPHAAGGLYSTVGDLLLWDQALYSERLVPARALEAMFTECKNGYCYGWFHGNLLQRAAQRWLQTGIGGSGHDSYGHGGGISGFATQVIRFPKEKVYIAVLSNYEWAQSSIIAEKLSFLFFNPENER
jgi:CubicO group peptidase (beta-lactamase class C family)